MASPPLAIIGTPSKYMHLQLSLASLTSTYLTYTDNKQKQIQTSCHIESVSWVDFSCHYLYELSFQINAVALKPLPCDCKSLFRDIIFGDPQMSYFRMLPILIMFAGAWFGPGKSVLLKIVEKQTFLFADSDTNTSITSTNTCEWQLRGFTVLDCDWGTKQKRCWKWSRRGGGFCSKSWETWEC